MRYINDDWAENDSHMAHNIICNLYKPRVSPADLFIPPSTCSIPQFVCSNKSLHVSLCQPRMFVSVGNHLVKQSGRQIYKYTFAIAHFYASQKRCLSQPKLEQKVNQWVNSAQITRRVTTSELPQTRRTQPIVGTIYWVPGLHDIEEEDQRHATRSQQTNTKH